LSKGNVLYNCLISCVLNAVEVLIYTQDVSEMAHICSVQMGRKANKEKKIKIYR